MDEAQSDLIEWYKLETEFVRDRVRHTRYVGKAKRRNEEMKEDWSNCGELGRGGFGVVHKQIEKATGHYRAVKSIDKRLRPKLGYSRELLVMAILSKHPSLFVEFLGWFERPDSETLYIAMEYFEEGDLTRHIGTPLLQGKTVRNISKQILEGLKVMHQQGIAHRDIKPANIFVVSMSPVWVKLGDFGESKRILAEATTALRTQVSTPVYGAPEVLGLDSNSETSEYTNAVDIWSLGCVIYELLVGTKLFVSEVQVSRYYFGKWPFPEDKLKGLSPPTDDVGISLLKSMVMIQPEERPTAAGALSHAWLANLKSDNEDSGDDRDETTQGRNWPTLSRKRKTRPATPHRPMKRRGGRNLITQDNTRCTPGDVALGDSGGSQRAGDPTPLQSMLSTSAMVPSDAFNQGSVLRTRPWKSELGTLNFSTTHSKSPQALRKKKTSNIRQTSPRGIRQGIPQGQTLALEAVSSPPRGQLTQRNPCQIKRTKPAPRSFVTLGQELPTGEPAAQGKVDSSKTVRKIRRTKPTARGRGDGRNHRSATVDPTQNPNTKQSSSTGQTLEAGVTLNSGRNPNRNPSAGWSPKTEANRNRGRTSNRQYRSRQRKW